MLKCFLYMLMYVCVTTMWPNAQGLRTSARVFYSSQGQFILKCGCAKSVVGVSWGLPASFTFINTHRHIPTGYIRMDTTTTTTIGVTDLQSDGWSFAREHSPKSQRKSRANHHHIKHLSLAATTTPNHTPENNHIHLHLHTNTSSSSANKIASERVRASSKMALFKRRSDIP